MYKGNSQNMQRGVSRIQLHEYTIPLNITPEDEWDACKRRCQQIDDILKNPVSLNERKSLGYEKQAIQNRIRELREKTTYPKNFNQYIADVAKEFVQKHIWQAILKEAKKRMEAENDAP